MNGKNPYDKNSSADEDKNQNNHHPAKFKPVVEFINESKDFVLGFESGIVYQKLKVFPKEINLMVHSDNFLQIAAIARGLGYSILNMSTLPKSEQVTMALKLNRNDIDF